MAHDQMKMMKRFSVLTALSAGAAALAFMSYEVLGGNDGETACPDGQQMVRTNPPTKHPRFRCEKVDNENDYVKN